MHKFPIPIRKNSHNGDEYHREINQGSILISLNDVIRNLPQHAPA